MIVNEKDCEQMSREGQINDRYKIPPEERIPRETLSKNEKYKKDYELQQELTESFFKKVFYENEAFRDKEHFVRLAKASYPSPSLSIDFEDRLYESICASENATAFQAKYDRYKELLKQAKNDIDKIVANAKPMSSDDYCLNGELKMEFNESYRKRRV